jgi:hypothetical protein
VTDTYTGSSYLKGDTWFNEHHTYAVLWEPREYVRWYVDDLLLFEVGKEALAKKVRCWIFSVLTVAVGPAGLRQRVACRPRLLPGLGGKWGQSNHVAGWV